MRCYKEKLFSVTSSTQYLPFPYHTDPRDGISQPSPIQTRNWLRCTSIFIIWRVPLVRKGRLCSNWGTAIQCNRTAVRWSVCEYCNISFVYEGGVWLNWNLRHCEKNTKGAGEQRREEAPGEEDDKGEWGVGGGGDDKRIAFHYLPRAILPFLFLLPSCCTWSFH